MIKLWCDKLVPYAESQIVGANNLERHELLVEALDSNGGVLNPSFPPQLKDKQTQSA